MKKLPKILIAGAIAIGLGAIIAADHLDAPAVGGTTADITDFFAFESAENADNTVFVTSILSSLAPGTPITEFDENVLVEVNIDNTGDLVEDLVIQAIPSGTHRLNKVADSSHFSTRANIYPDR